MIMHFDQYNNLNWADWELVLLVILMVFFTKDTRHVERKTIVCNTTKKCVQHVKLKLFVSKSKSYYIPIAKKIWLSIYWSNFGSHVTVRTPICPSNYTKGMPLRNVTISSFCGGLQPDIAHPHCRQLSTAVKIGIC